ncbi:hypothetical protein PSHT_06104 [Puccinia striiformis]|uniref:Ubiquitin carboxyl-terminal hydrolase 7 ICP0-binding domain-containing protein n=1 Tax=Puccinia striiformis TaxID=27350 RepID=A0A2S4W905_9BASI|nr:hypothetical protein PSHT_06104 [Puccinia striiformis]
MDESDPHFIIKVCSLNEPSEPCVRLWPLRERAEFALRPHTPVPEDDPALSKSQSVRYDVPASLRSVIKTDKASDSYRGDLNFTLEMQMVPIPRILPRMVELASGVISPTSDELPPIIFLKHFDPPKQKLAGIGHLHFASKGILTSLHWNA